MTTVYPLPTKEKTRCSDVLVLALELYRTLLQGVEVRHGSLKYELEVIHTRKLQGLERADDAGRAEYLAEQMNILSSRIAFLRESVAETEEKIARRDSRPARLTLALAS